MLASILVATHDHAGSLPLAVGSALGQTVADLEVVIVGDGMTGPTRAAAQKLAGADSRVVVLDLPKGPHHGEVHRDRAVRGARSEAIFYLCDDDLLLPRHVQNLLPLLADADLVQCRNAFVDVTGELRMLPTDLADPAAVAWHLREPPRNLTSLTGTAHRRSSYLALAQGWTTTPPGEWPDHYMWKKLMTAPGFRGATHPELTAVQLPTSEGRQEWDQERRLGELARWRDRIGEPDGHDWLQELAVRATARQLDRATRAATDADVQRTQLHRRVEALTAEIERLRGSVAELRGSRSWQVTGPLRRGAQFLRGRQR